MSVAEGPEWLNYHHLLYFWAVVTEGSVTAAARRLHVSQPTVSGQIRELERRIGERLVERRGRGLALTETGRLVHQHAQGIFAAGADLVDVLHGRASPQPLRLVAGLVDALPKLVAHRLLANAVELGGASRLVVREGPPERLLQDLARHELDVVIADEPLRLPPGVRVFHHLLGESGVTFFATRALLADAGPRASFPGMLDGAPLLVPGTGSSLRRSLDAFVHRHGLQPRITGEFDDLALMKVFGEAGAGFFPAPSVVEDDVVRRHRVRIVGRTREVTERFYALSPERRVRHPAVLALCESARAELFGS